MLTHDGHLLQPVRARPAQDRPFKRFSYIEDVLRADRDGVAPLALSRAASHECRRGRGSIRASPPDRRAHRRGACLGHFLARGAESAQWDDTALLRAKALRLTATELEELHQGIDALPSSLWAAHMLEAPDGVRTARVLTLAYPSLLEEA